MSWLVLFFQTFCFIVLSLYPLSTHSAAIMTYLVDKYNLPDHWYPKELQKRAKIDEYLHWHHNYLRWVARKIYLTVSLQCVACLVKLH